MKNKSDELIDMGVSHTDSIRKKNRDVVDYMRQAIPEFLEWFDQIARYGGNLIDATILEVEVSGPPKFRVQMFTDRHAYTMRVEPDYNDKHNGQSGYMGVTAHSRKQRAGESWNRGNDLADGPYCKETWSRILSSIVSYEMVRLGK